MPFETFKYEGNCLDENDGDDDFLLLQGLWIDDSIAWTMRTIDGNS